MFQHTSVLGISMTLRHNRRVLVTLVYLALFLAAATLSTLDPLAPGRQNVIWVYLMVMLVSYWMFGWLVRPGYPSDRNRTTHNTLHVSPDVPEPRAEEDERENALRSESYAFAYKAIAIYSVVLLLLFPALISRESLASLPGAWGLRNIVLQFMVLSLFILVFTLPQAAILWNQCDLFVENQDR